MTHRSSAPSGSGKGSLPVEIDRTVAHAARVYDYLLGGVDNFAVDRAAAERQTEAIGGMEVARADVRANRAFLDRVVRHLAGEAGIRQFLDIGTGIPNADNVHGVAQQVAPESRVVYVDNDPVVLAHSLALLRSTPPGATAYLDGDLRHPESILERASETLDLGEPVGVMLLGILHFVLDADDPYGIVRRLLAAVPPGSYVAVSHLASDVQPDEMAKLAKLANERVKETAVLRSRAEVGRFLDGLDLLDPGVVPVDRWRPTPGAPPPAGPRITPIHGAVARKS